MEKQNNTAGKKKATNPSDFMPMDFTTVIQGARFLHWY